ncbi:opacity family porin [Deinococcus malanensis]
MIGSKNILGPVGARVAAEYAPGKNGFNADVTATYHLETGSAITPYVGAGLGLSSSTGRTRNANGTVTGFAGNATDTYVNVLAGVDFNITDSIAAYVEGNGRYYMTNNGTGTGLANTARNGFNVAGKVGLKFFF